MNINKYVTTSGAANDDIYLDSSNQKLKLNVNNYVVDNNGTVIMDPQNKLTVNITNQQSGEIYLNQYGKLKLRLGPLLFTDSSGHFYPTINDNHGLDWENYKCQKQFLKENDKHLHVLNSYYYIIMLKII